MAQVKKSTRFTAQAQQSANVNSYAADLKAENSQAGQTHYEWIALDSLVPDPTNARGLNLTRELLLAPIESLPPEQQPYVESIHRMAAAILDHGQINAIQAYRKPGGMHEIISGERRYWACTLNLLRATTPEEQFSRSRAKVEIHHARPANLKLQQLDENLNREDLPLAGKLRAVESAWKEWCENHPETSTSGRSMAKCLNLPVTEAATWHFLITEDSPIRGAVLRGDLPSLWAVRKLRSLKPDQLALVIPKIAQHGYNPDLIAEYAGPSDPSDESAPASPPPAPKGRPPRPLVRPPITQRSARWLYEKLSDALGLPQDVDWSSQAKARKAFMDLLSHIDGQG